MMRLVSPPDPQSTHVEVFGNGARCEYREVADRGWYSLAFDTTGHTYGRRATWLRFGRQLPPSAVAITPEMRTSD